MSNNTFALVENHPLTGRSLQFVVVAVYSNAFLGRQIAKIQDPDGHIQFRELELQRYKKFRIFSCLTLSRLYQKLKLELIS